jgi:hypothetical protein
MSGKNIQMADTITTTVPDIDREQSEIITTTSDPSSTTTSPGGEHKKFLVINDFNDINDAVIRHFSLDKGHHLAIALGKLGHDISFLTTKRDYVKNGISYVNVNNITTNFIRYIDYVIIVREPLFADILEKIPAIRESIAVEKTVRNGPKYIVKSDSPIWFRNKVLSSKISTMFNLVNTATKEWIINHLDFICAQNELFARTATRIGVPRKSLLLSSMSVAKVDIEYDKLTNPYTVDHSYCVESCRSITEGRALMPVYYIEHPEEREFFNKQKKILIYTGRIKTDQGRILLNMRNIMNLLGDDYELHIFPGSFVIPFTTPQPVNKAPIPRSGKDCHSLDCLRREIFGDCKNVIIHFPYRHSDKYRYLHFADCGIDFSDVRPTKNVGMAGHAKILEYCEMGLPTVCEENIQNTYLLNNGGNGIILPYLATDEQYAEAIRTITGVTVDRDRCRRITTTNENWNRRMEELMNQINANSQ